MQTPTVTSGLKVISERRAVIASICCQFSCLRFDATTKPANQNSRSPGYRANALTTELIKISICRTCMTRKLSHSCQTIMLSERRNINKFRASFDSLLSSNILCISEESSLEKELRPSKIVESGTNVKKVIDAICSFTNPFNTERCAEEFYCL